MNAQIDASKQVPNEFPQVQAGAESELIAVLHTWGSILIAIIISFALDFSPPIPDDYELQAPKYMGVPVIMPRQSICVTVASGWVTVQEADSSAREVSVSSCRVCRIASSASG